MVGSCAYSLQGHVNARAFCSMYVLQAVERRGRCFGIGIVDVVLVDFVLIHSIALNDAVVPKDRNGMLRGLGLYSAVSRCLACAGEEVPEAI